MQSFAHKAPHGCRYTGAMAKSIKFSHLSLRTQINSKVTLNVSMCSGAIVASAVASCFVCNDCHYSLTSVFFQTA